MIGGWHPVLWAVWCMIALAHLVWYGCRQMERRRQARAAEDREWSAAFVHRWDEMSERDAETAELHRRMRQPVSDGTSGPWRWEPSIDAWVSLGVLEPDDDVARRWLSG